MEDEKNAVLFILPFFSESRQAKVGFVDVIFPLVHYSEIRGYEGFARISLVILLIQSFVVSNTGMTMPSSMGSSSSGGTRCMCLPASESVRWRV